MSISDAIYKRDSKGKVRVWSAEVEGNKYRIIAGLLDGKLVFSEWKTTVGKNIGKSNETTAESQAWLEVDALLVKKTGRGYFFDLADIDNLDEIPFKPMLAAKYVEGKLNFPVYSQPKLDGIRCIANKKGLWTRAGKPILTCGHIWDALKPVFARDDSVTLDGELYNHDLRDDFNKITSLVRRESPSAEEAAAVVELVQYHVYDVVGKMADVVFKTRSAKLTYIFENKRDDDRFAGRLENDIIKIVPSRFCFNQADLDSVYDQYLDDGYEGQMIRLNERYENKRSKFLLKRKEFIDEEFKLLRIEEGVGNWAGYAKRVTFELPDGRECGAGVKGNQAFTKKLLQNKEDFIGGDVTVRYFRLTPDGMPRFPVVVAFYRGKRDL